jgi:hypothetical protein
MPDASLAMLEQIRSELGAEIADHPRVVAAVLTSAAVERAATRLAQAIELVATALTDPAEFVEQPNTRPAALIRPTGSILR